MKPNFHESESEKTSELMQHSSNAEVEKVKPTDDKTIQKIEQPKQLITATVSGSQLPFSSNQLTIIGVLIVAVFATFFLVTRGNDFCFFSTCMELPLQNPVVYSFWSLATGLAAYGVLALIGISVPVAVVGGLIAWFLMQMSVH